MKRLLPRCLLNIGLILLVGCGPSRPSIFAPQVSIDTLQLADQGPSQLVLRLKSDSYAMMRFQQLDAQLLIPGHPPLPLHARLDLEIPALSADASRLPITIPAAIRADLTASRQTLYGLPYRIVGQVTATSGSATTIRIFDFSHEDRFYPVPGDPRGYR